MHDSEFDVSKRTRGRGYIRAEEIGKRLDNWAMARVVYGVLDERGISCQLAVVAVHDDIVEWWWGLNKDGESGIYVTARSLIDSNKANNTLSLRLQPDSVDDTASLLPLALHFFNPEHAAIARRNAHRANWSFRTLAEMLCTMSAFAFPISVCSNPSRTWSGDYAGQRARTQ
jgi:hypothetical protein